MLSKLALPSVIAVFLLVAGVVAQTPDEIPPNVRGAGAGLVDLASRSAESAGSTAAAGDLIAFSRVDASGTQTITLVHTRKMHLAVYHIQPSGQTVLVNSRPIDADFSLTLNPAAPLPSHIRRMSGESK